MLVSKFGQNLDCVQHVGALSVVFNLSATKWLVPRNGLRDRENRRVTMGGFQQIVFVFECV